MQCAQLFFSSWLSGSSSTVLSTLVQVTWVGHRWVAMVTSDITPGVSMVMTHISMVRKTLVFGRGHIQSPCLCMGKIKQSQDNMSDHTCIFLGWWQRGWISAWILYYSYTLVTSSVLRIIIDNQQSNSCFMKSCLIQCSKSYQKFGPWAEQETMVHACEIENIFCWTIRAPLVFRTWI
jgi:hypothetical protein